MPHIIVKAATEQQAAGLAKAVSPRLAQLCGCPADWLVYEWQQPKFFGAEGPVAPDPMVEVWWFPRSLEAQDGVAKAIYDYFIGQGCQDCQVAFIAYEKRAFYEGGEHY